jgi:hypothetical protein
MSDGSDTAAPAVRASDAERDRITVFLKRQTVAGRLTVEELEQRIGAAYSARTREELRTLLADLPADAARALEPARVTDSRPRLCWLWFVCPLAPLVFWLLAGWASRTSPCVTVNEIERRPHDGWHEVARYSGRRRRGSGSGGRPGWEPGVIAWPSGNPQAR